MGFISSFKLVLIEIGKLNELGSFSYAHIFEPTLVNDEVSIKLSALKQLLAVHDTCLFEVFGPSVFVLVLKHVYLDEF